MAKIENIILFTHIWIIKDDWNTTKNQMEYRSLPNIGKKYEI